MSYGLVKVLSIGAAGLITASAVERGWRVGKENGDSAHSKWDANTLINSTMQTSDDFVIDGIGQKINDNMFAQKGFLYQCSKIKGAVAGVGEELVKSLPKLAIAGAAFLIGGPLGAIGLGILGLGFGKKVLESSGLKRADRIDVLG